MANIFTNLNLTADSNFFITQKINSIGYVGENTVTRLNIEVPEITEGATYELEIENSAGEKNVALLSADVENNTLYLDFTANMLTVNDLIMMQLRVTYADNSIKKSNRFAMKIAKSISATDYYEEYAVTIFDQLVAECRDIIEGAESYAIRAETAAVNAEAYEQSASASASTASASATSAATSASNASNSATSASTSASNAATSETNAAASASAASTSAANANTSATNAANSATSAATSATNAHNSEVNASNSETNASTSATEAAASAESIAASAAQINENTYRINDLEAIIAGYQLADLPTGAVASVTDGTALLMPSLKVDIEPAQEGSGDPSPENIRPISGWTAANVNVSPTTSAEDGTTYTIQFRDGDNPLTVYGGTLDVTSGELVVDRASVDLGTLNDWTIYNAERHIFWANVNDAKIYRDNNEMPNIISSQYVTVKGSYAWINGIISMYQSSSNIIVCDTRFSYATDFKTAMNGVQLVYELAEPITYHLTPTQVRTLVGNNNIWADTGDIISGKYYKSLN